MLMDFYELTMSNTYFEKNMRDTIAYFDVFFRQIPDNGGYAICAGLEQVIDYIAKPMGIKLNKELNNNIAKFKKYQEGVISTADSNIAIYVIPTNEEYMIALDTYNLVK